MSDTILTPDDLKAEFGADLKPLQCGELGLVRDIEVKRLDVRMNDGRKTHYFRASDATLDREGDIIEPKGWDLKDYRRNPVVLDSHRRGSVAFILGTATEMSVTDEGLVLGIQFSKANPLGRIAEGLVEEKALNAGSVGMRPQAIDRSAAQRRGARRVITKSMLLEFSMTPVPVNQNALELSIKSGSVREEDVVELIKMLKPFCSEKADPPVDPGAKAGELDVAQLVQQAWDAAVWLRPNP